ncbi:MULTISPECIES: hypothetical protein [unclassified Moorena]|uniref:hypothetical protein n=1 Tax=unclassified Moorena TaxID=2683338 RepID=UPI0013C56073|nr:MULTISPECIES: hypothetical protein [unclassified Moorena]NEO20265.1 hypothetical protein [Moorena sp. SIO4A5]NEQ60203.1 hypothetical protein [Moorena sp. SIO4A1]
MAKVRWSYSATFLYPDSRLPTPDSLFPSILVEHLISKHYRHQIPYATRRVFQLSGS